MKNYCKKCLQLKLKTCKGHNNSSSFTGCALRVGPFTNGVIVQDMDCNKYTVISERIGSALVLVEDKDGYGQERLKEFLVLCEEETIEKFFTEKERGLK